MSPSEPTVAPQREALLADTDPQVREAARIASRVLDPAAMEADLPERDCHYRHLLLTNYAVSQAVAERCLAEATGPVGHRRQPPHPGRHRRAPGPR